MAAIVWDDVVDIAAELSAVGADARTKILAFVNGALDTTLFDGGEDSDRLHLARIYLAAHFGSGALPGSGSSGPPGTVTSESAGGLSRSYATMAAATATGLVGGTWCGQQYQALVRPVSAGPWSF